jgi:peptide deformylase
MAVRKIVKVGSELLRKKSSPITEFGTEELIKLKKDLFDTLVAFRKKHKLGRGIAAVQIGVLKKAIYVMMDDFEDFLINPKIISKSKKKSWYWDSCFSVDVAFFIRLLRPFEIEVEYYNLNGKKKVIQAKDHVAELLQHEIDHLKGKLFIDYWDKDKNNFVMREIHELTKRN